MRWRAAHPALHAGSIRFLDTPEHVLAFIRECPDECLLIAFNLSGSTIELPLPAGIVPRRLDCQALRQGSIEDARLHLPGYGTVFAGLDPAAAQVLEREFRSKG